MEGQSRKLVTRMQRQVQSGRNVNVGNLERRISGLAGAALLLSSIGKPSPGRAARAIGGGALLYRSFTGHCPLYQALGANMAQSERPGSNGSGNEVERSITIDASPEELHGFWRDPKRLTTLMGHVVHAEPLDDTRVRWHAEAPRGRSIEWETRIVEDRPPEIVTWRTEDGVPLSNEVSIRFRSAASNRGTVATLRFRFDPPGGALGDAAAALLRIVPRTLVEQVLRRFKSLIETGEMPTLENNPTARRGRLANVV
jgi:uncharacterized membrane protein